MKHSEFISQLDESRVLAAIHAAEERTSAPIRAVVSRRATRDPLVTARRHFVALGMARAPQKNAVLIFIAPPSHTFAIYADANAYAHGPSDFWDQLRDEMTTRLKASQFTDAVVRAVEQAAVLLAKHFPAAETQNHQAVSNP